MPRKQTVKFAQKVDKGVPGPRKVQKDDEWGGYVQCSLGESEKESYQLWLSENPAAMPAMLVDALASGLKLTAVWDGQNQCFITSLTGRPDVTGEVEFTTTLSARGGTLEEALTVLMYKHFEVMGGDWTDWLINGSKSQRTFG